MITNVLKKVFGTRNDRELKRMGAVVKKINTRTDAMKALDDKQLGGKADGFRERLAEGETMDRMLPEAFAVAREASERGRNMRRFDVQ